MEKRIDLKEKTDEEILFLSDFIEHFNAYYTLLLKRYARYKTNVNGNDIDANTYFDMIMVQLRAILAEDTDRCENRNNYTILVLLRLLKENEKIEMISAMLNKPFFSDSDFSIRAAIKFYSNKCICHYDNLDGIKLGNRRLVEMIETQLKNPYADVNLNYIMKTLTDCLGEGLVYCSVRK